MLKKILSSSLFVFAVLSARSSLAAGGPTGVGLIIGDPTGISAKHWLTQDTAIQAAVAWTVDKANVFLVQGDYLWHTPGLVKVGSADFLLHYGVGAAVLFGDANAFAVRVPVGLSYRFQVNPIDIFFEIAPVVLLAPSTDFDMQVGLGARYYF
ncbi:MAG: hypothetical protein ABIO95_00910 [Bdellovibrionota bacterium]